MEPSAGPARSSSSSPTGHADKAVEPLLVNAVPPVYRAVPPPPYTAKAPPPPYATQTPPSVPPPPPLQLRPMPVPPNKESVAMPVPPQLYIKVERESDSEGDETHCNNGSFNSPGSIMKNSSFYEPQLGIGDPYWCFNKNGSSDVKEIIFIPPGKKYTDHCSEHASRPGNSRIPGRDHRRYYHEHWRTEYLMDFDHKQHRMICMVCGSSLATLKLSTIKRHIKQKHPDSLLWSMTEREVIITSWEAHLSVEAQSGCSSMGTSEVSDPVQISRVSGGRENEKGAGQTRCTHIAAAGYRKRRRLEPVSVPKITSKIRELNTKPPQNANHLEKYLNESLQNWFKVEFLMDYDSHGNRLVCMMCGSSLSTLSLEDIKKHILQTHPNSLAFSSEEKQCIMMLWNQKASLQAVDGLQPVKENQGGPCGTKGLGLGGSLTMSELGLPDKNQNAATQTLLIIPDALKPDWKADKPEVTEGSMSNTSSCPLELPSRPEVLKMDRNLDKDGTAHWSGNPSKLSPADKSQSVSTETSLVIPDTAKTDWTAEKPGVTESSMSNSSSCLPETPTRPEVPKMEKNLDKDGTGQCSVNSSKMSQLDNDESSFSDSSMESPRQGTSPYCSSFGQPPAFHYEGKRPGSTFAREETMDVSIREFLHVYNRGNRMLCDKMDNILTVFRELNENLTRLNCKLDKLSPQQLCDIQHSHSETQTD